MSQGVEHFGKGKTPMSSSLTKGSASMKKSILNVENAVKSEIMKACGYAWSDEKTALPGILPETVPMHFSSTAHCCLTLS